MKVRFRQSLTCLCLFLTFVITAQELPEIIPPSPTVANLMQFEEVPVSYYTGQPNISVPLYGKAVAPGLNVNVALSYNTQGVQVNNVSGWTGTGWSLIAGGSISRTVRGEPDEITKASSTNKTGIFHLDDYWNYDNLSGAQKQEFNFKVAGEPADKYDNQPDLYQFNFMGYTGRFLIMKELGVLVPKMVNLSDKLKVEITYNANFVVSQFKITDLNGYKYTFNVVETSTTTPFTGTVAQGPNGTGVISSSAASGSYAVNTAWHLSKVETPNNLLLLTFDYFDSWEAYNASYSFVTNEIINYGSGYNDLVANSYNQGILEPKKSVSYSTISTLTKKLEKITLNREGIEVLFAKDNVYVHPETNGDVLKTVTIKRNASINKTYTFSYEETADTDLAPLVLKRLWLTKLTESAGNINQDYEFSYHNKQDLPGFFKHDIRGDSWGYHSGINLGEFSCSNQIYNDDIIKTGLLTAIRYPTGGVKEFEFEHNSYSYFQDISITSNDYLQNPRNAVPQSSYTDNFVYNHNGLSAPTVTIDNFTLNYAQDIYVSSWVTATPSQYLSDHVIKIYNAGYERYIDLNLQCEILQNVPAGTYTIALAPYNNLNTATYQIAGDFRVNYTSISSNLREEMIGGGVRIKEITFKDSQTSLTNEKKIRFEYNDEDNPIKSSGVVDSKSDRLERVYLSNKSRYLFANVINFCGSLAPRVVQYQVREKRVNAELTQGSYVGYRFVKVYETGNGYTSYNYTSPYDFPAAPETLEYETPVPKANLDYKRGLLINERIYNEQSQLLKHVSYLDSNEQLNYEFTESFIFRDRQVYRPNCPFLQFYSSYNFYVSGTVENHVPASTSGNCTAPAYPPAPCGAFPSLGNDFKAGWAKLKGTTTKEYFYPATGAPIIKEVRKEFDYNPQNYQVSVEDTYYDKSGSEEHLQTKYYYPVGISLNSNTSTVKNALVNLNKINEVLETQSYRNGVKLSEMHNIYHQFATNQVLLKEVKVGKNTLTPDKRIEFHRYDSYGNVLEVSKADGTKISYIYGFNGSLPVAKITNANYSQVESIIGTTMLTGNLTTSQRNNLLNGLGSAMINFLEHDPAVGITKTFNERGLLNSFDYDPFNRLIRVKDHAGKVEGFNAYNYKNQY